MPCPHLLARGLRLRPGPAVRDEQPGKHLLLSLELRQGDHVLGFPYRIPVIDGDEEQEQGGGEHAEYRGEDRCYASVDEYLREVVEVEVRAVHLVRCKEDTQGKRDGCGKERGKGNREGEQHAEEEPGL